MNILCINQGVSTNGTLYLLNDNQYLITNDIFDAPSAGKNATINHKPFTMHKTGKEVEIYGKEFYYLDDIKVVA